MYDVILINEEIKQENRIRVYGKNAAVAVCYKEQQEIGMLRCFLCNSSQQSTWWRYVQDTDGDNPQKGIAICVACFPETDQTRYFKLTQKENKHAS